MKFKIKNVKNKFKGGYIGMNYYAGKKHFNIPLKKKKEIDIYCRLNKNVRKHTIKHEEIEASLMKKGKEYKTAHKVALKYEKSNQPIKKILKQVNYNRRRKNAL